MKITLKRLNDAVHFEGSNEDGNTVHIDGSPAIGGEGKGLRPMQLLLVSLGPCSSMDVVCILKKMRQRREDIQVEVKGSAVYVSISDNLLFSTASSKVSKEAYEVLGKVARIINDHDQVNVLVEGHTDNVPIANEKYSDNWDLSVLRATTIVKILVEEGKVDPKRVLAAGRGEFMPLNNDNTKEGRQQNRRTEIILTPKLIKYIHPECGNQNAENTAISFKTPTNINKNSDRSTMRIAMQEKAIEIEQKTLRQRGIMLSTAPRKRMVFWGF